MFIEGFYIKRIQHRGSKITKDTKKYIKSMKKYDAKQDVLEAFMEQAE